MATPAVIGVSAGKQFLHSSFLPTELADRLLLFHDHGTSQLPTSVWKCAVVAKKVSDSRTQCSHNKKTQTQITKALKEHADTFSVSSINEAPCRCSSLMERDENFELEHSLEALTLLQRFILEKQWCLESVESTNIPSLESHKKMEVVRSGNPSARQRRLDARKGRILTWNLAKSMAPTASTKNQQYISLRMESLRDQMTDYMKGMLNGELLTHKEVVCLSEKMHTGLSLQECKFRLQEKLGYEPSDVQWAAAMNMSPIELHAKLMESSIATEKLTMSNIRLVLSIARKYENLGIEMADLVQEGLIGLVRGIEKFDSSKGFKLSTYVYWWIRQGISRALAEHSRTVRLPTHLHERLGLIRSAKLTLEDEGVSPSPERIATTLKISDKMVANATKANKRMISLDRQAYRRIDSSANDTLHNYIADPNIENRPWFIVENNSLKEDVNKLISSTLSKREQVIVRLYYGLDKGCSTWEDISGRLGLSRERVRQVGLVALEKLKEAARHGNLDPVFTQN